MAGVVLISVPHTASRATKIAFCPGVDVIWSSVAKFNIGVALHDVHGSLAEPERVEKARDLMAGGRNVYTVRDPFAAMLTGIARTTMWPEHTVASWLALRDLVSEFGGLPVRFGLDPGTDIQAAFDAFDLYDAPTPLRVWNPSEPNALIAAYKAGDMAYVAEHAPEPLAQMQAVEGELRPWLESLGYTDLPWWS